MSFSSKKPGSIAILIACIILIVLAISSMVCSAGIVSDRTGVQKNPDDAVLASDGSCSILFPSPAGTDDQIGQVIDDWINKNAPASSPLKGKGKLIAQSGRNGHVNPSLIAAIARKESSFGTAGRGVSKHNPFGRMNTSHTLMTFDSWDAAIADEGPYIKRMYIDTGQTTVGTFVNKHSPPSENNTSQYIQQVTTWMSEMAKAGNGTILGAPCLGSSDTTGVLAGRLNVPYVRQNSDDWCGRSSQEMVAAFFNPGNSKYLDPSFQNDKKNGPLSPGTLNSLTGKKYQYGNYSLDKVTKSLKAGNPVIFYSNLGRKGHIFVLTGYDGTTFWANNTFGDVSAAKDTQTILHVKLTATNMQNILGQKIYGHTILYVNVP